MQSTNDWLNSMDDAARWQKMKDNAVHMLIEQKPPHPGLKFQPIDYGDYMNIRLFLDNFAEFSEPKRQDLAFWIGELVKKVRDMGIPCYIEAWESETYPGKFDDKEEYL